MNTHTGTVTLPFKISDEQLDDFMGLGAGYWARGLQRVPGMANFWSVVEYADGPPETHHFTTADIISAFERCVANKNRQGEGIMVDYIAEYFRLAVTDTEPDGTIDAGCIDAEAGDVLLQVILFDEIKYG